MPLLSKANLHTFASLFFSFILLIAQGKAVLAQERIWDSSSGYGYGYMGMKDPETGELIINEFVSRPLPGEKEWIEIFNSSSLLISLDACRLEDARGAIYQFKMNESILPKEFVIAPLSSSKLNNTGDRIRLLCGEAVLDELAYGDFSGGEKPTRGTVGYPEELHYLPSSGAGKSLGRVPDGWPLWYELSSPSPGEPNRIINSAPAAVIRVQGTGKTEGCDTLAVNTTGEDSSDPEGDRLEYSWEYRAEASNTLLHQTDRENPLSFRFERSQGERFIVHLVVTDPYGERSEAKIRVRLGACPPKKVTQPLVSFQYSNELVISELFPNPEGADSGVEFVELYNKGRIALRLDGWRLGGKTKKKLDELIIQPGGFLILENITLRNAGDSIQLLDPNESIISESTYPEAKEGKSWSRDEKNLFRWTVPTKGEANDFPFQTETIYLQANSPLIITRFLPNPIGKDEGKEWIEIENQTDARWDLKGWSLDNREGGSKPFELSSFASLPPHSSLKIMSSESQVTLRNSSDQVRLLDASGVVRDLLEWKSPAADGQVFTRNQLIRDLSIAPEEALVVRVVDGDTIDVKRGGDIERVRLIGVDTPETVHPFKELEYFGKEASAYTKSRLEGKVVRLEYDLTKRGKYGRLLAYVWLEEIHFNAELIARGYSFAYLKYPFRYREEFRLLEKQAREAGIGLWGSQEIELIREEQEAVRDEELEELEAFEELLKEEEEEEEVDEEPTEEEEDQEKEWNGEGGENIKLNEILPNPEGKDSLQGEYLELVNLGEMPVDLSGWSVLNGKKRSILSLSGEMQPGVRLFHPEKTIKNSSETLQLMDPQGQIRDEWSYEQSMKDEQVWSLSPLTLRWQRVNSGSPGEENPIILLAPGEDDDGDGLRNNEESQWGFDAKLWDSDGNGIPDDAELLLRHQYIRSYPEYLSESLRVQVKQTLRTLRFFGESRPYSEVILSVLPSDQETSIPVQPDGTWEYKVDIGLEAGGHRFIFQVRDPNGILGEEENFLDISLPGRINVAKLPKKRTKKTAKGFEPLYVLPEDEEKEESPIFSKKRKEGGGKNEPWEALSVLLSLLGSMAIKQKFKLF